VPFRSPVRCFLVGDDYGRTRTRPWGVAVPKGLPPTDVPVHPTQLYEAIPLVVLAWVLTRWRREGVSDPVVLSRYLILAGALRFAIEFVRLGAPVLGPLTLAHLWSIGLMLVGLSIGLWAFAFGHRAPTNKSGRPQRPHAGG
jgi:phosphatidylglycerol:prolipoprotein diacylglycerol transferase